MIKQLVETKPLQDIINYLESRPYSEVKLLIDNLMTNYQTIEIPDPVSETPVLETPPLTEEDKLLASDPEPL